MIKPLTSLRFFFALMVFTSHLSFVQTDWAWYQWLKRNVFFEGYLGVSFFFILSGFILSYNYQENFLKGKVSKKKFYIARFARIYPLHILTFFLAFILLYPSSITGIGPSISNLALIQSFIPIEEYYFSYNSPSWSISNEMFFYLLFPILLLINKNRYLILIALISVIIILGISYTPDRLHKIIFYINPLFRIFDFFLGIVLYNLFTSKFLKSYIEKNATLLEIVSCLIFLLFLGLHNYVERGYRYSIYYWIPMLLIIFTFSYQKGIISKILSHPILVKLGEISFGFYMFHYLIILYFLNQKATFFGNMHDIVFSSLILFSTLIISFVSYSFYEKPLHQYIKNKFIK